MSRKRHPADRPSTALSARRQRGLSLVEAMIALLVFSTGIMGVAAMQVSGMRFTKGAQNLTVGALLADEMAERMRANIDGAQAGEYDNLCVCNGTCTDTARAASCARIVSSCPSDPANVTRACYGAECTTTAAITAADVNEWLVRVCETTPPGTLAGIYCSGTCGATANRAIIVSWEDVDTSDVAATSAHDFVLSFQPIKPKH